MHGEVARRAGVVTEGAAVRTSVSPTKVGGQKRMQAVCLLLWAPAFAGETEGGGKGAAPYVGRLARIAWMMVPSSSQSRSPPTGTPRASEVTLTPAFASRSAI